MPDRERTAAGTRQSRLVLPVYGKLRPAGELDVGRLARELERVVEGRRAEVYRALKTLRDECADGAGPASRKPRVASAATTSTISLRKKASRLRALAEARAPRRLSRG